MPRGTHPNSLANLQKGKRFESSDDSARKAQEKSIAAHAERRTFREGLLLLLEAPIKDKEGNASGKTTQDAIIAGLVKRAISGDTRAFEMIRDTIGEKPVEQVNFNTPDTGIMAEIRRRMEGDAQ